MEWRPVKGFEGLYVVSAAGTVKRMPGHRCQQERVLKQRPKPEGYLNVSLCQAGKPSTHYVHRLVAAAFLPAPNRVQTQVNHKNGDKTDNRVENLEWATPQENAFAARRMGQDNACALLQRGQVVAILNEFAHTDASIEDLAQRYAAELTHPTAAVRAIISRARWQHVPCDEAALAAAYKRKKYQQYGGKALPTAQQATSIRDGRAAGLTYRELAAQHGFSQETVRRVIKRMGRYATL